MNVLINAFFYVFLPFIIFLYLGYKIHQSLSSPISPDKTIKKKLVNRKIDERKGYAITSAKYYIGTNISNRLDVVKAIETILTHFHNIYLESIVVLFLDQNNVCVDTKVKFGNEYSVDFSPNDICAIAKRINASKLIVAHNHPDNRSIPSDNDVYFAANLTELATRKSIKVIENLVWCDNELKSIQNTLRYKQMIKPYDNI